MSTTRTLRMELGAGKQLRFCSSSVVDMLERRIDARFCELDEAFMEMEKTVAVTNSDFLESSDEIGAMKISRVDLLPFKHEDASSAMWLLTTSGKFPDGDHSCVVKRSENVNAITSSVSLQLESKGTIDIRGYIVMKRFQTSKEYRVLMESSAEWIVSLPGSGVWSHMTREKGSFVIHEYSIEGCAIPGMCQSRAELCMSPSEFTGQHPKMKPCMLQEIVVPSFRDLIRSRHQFGENALFDAIRA